MSNRVGPSDDAQAAARLLNLEQRDPLKVHDPTMFKVAWADVFAEPDPGVHSLSAIFRASYHTFNFTRLWTYRILSLCGVFSACCFGINYGCTACSTIWCCMPSLTLCRNMCIPIKMGLMIFLDACVQPFIYVWSFLLWNIRISVIKDGSQQTV